MSSFLQHVLILMISLRMQRCAPRACEPMKFCHLSIVNTPRAQEAALGASWTAA
ncbi:hypothetical protein TSUD_356200 [Trifolium subterraneum]|uniref:Uncharacterized protein n=1 Tax=Trifolium subterraneum TaxID=3900 RepID=A0A2Z6MMH1_TRISU|nr:hypothetical protein TSUD_356200 [Trifolium subterraneum]